MAKAAKKTESKTQHQMLPFVPYFIALHLSSFLIAFGAMYVLIVLVLYFFFALVSFFFSSTPREAA
jgi:hypothetical protein